MNNYIQGGSFMNMMQMPNSMMPMMCVMMGIGLIVFIIVTGVTFYYVARKLMKKIRTEDRPLMLLKERLIKGEISEEEYSRIKKTLMNL
jgi:putative membrane protein